MVGIRSLLTAALLGGASLVRADLKLVETYDGKGLMNQWDFIAIPDPTHGFVKYENAKNGADLVSTKNNKIRLSVDTKSKKGPRRSIRISSKRKFTKGVFLADIEHMPVGPGVWPAYWSFGDNWPNNGEIDVLEGVNSQKTNSVALHTRPGLIVNNKGSAPGTVLKDGNGNCALGGAVPDDGTQGCSQHTTAPYGQAFNAIKGGVYATHWGDGFVSIYFFPRNAIPKDIRDGQPKPSTWGTPLAKFQGKNINDYLKEHNLLFNITFCGDWAGNVFGQDPEMTKFGPTCEGVVGSRPELYREAYWLINSLKVFQEGGNPTGKPTNYNPLPPPPFKRAVPFLA